MDEGCKDNKERRGKCHETPFRATALVDLDFSASGILPLGCSRGTSPTVSATLGPATALPSGTLIATRSIEEKYPPKRWHGQGAMA